jgi:membrane protein
VAARVGGRSKAYRARLVRLLAGGPRRPSDLSRKDWYGVMRRTFSEFIDDDLNDRAASLTYYGVLSIFPGLLVLASIVGLLGRNTTDNVLENIRSLAPGLAQDIIAAGISDVKDHHSTASVIAVVGVLIASYSATSYVGGFIRAANAIYDVPEGRPLWKTVPLQLVFTAITGAFLVVSAFSIVLTGGLAQAAGKALGLERQTVLVFDIVKWPVLVLAASMLIALLYWAAPNARQGGFRWITPGSLLAVIVWGIVSAGFAIYIAKFGSYNHTYGTLGGIIGFLVWLWLTNVAILLGAEFDAELARARAMASGLPSSAEPYVPLRDIPGDEQAADPVDFDFDAPGRRDSTKA